MTASEIEIGDLVQIQLPIVFKDIGGVMTGKVVDKFLGESGNETYDIKTLWGRVAAREEHVITNHGKRTDSEN
jgi:hypothetical protein